MTKRYVAKDFYKLQKNIFSFSNGEARVIEFDDELKSFQVELNIKDGYYKDGIFVFEVRITDEYPTKPPEVQFNSQIFHPNIGDGFEDVGLVCLNLLDELWQATNDLEDVVQGMLFLVKNPAVDDALNPHFGGFDNSEEYMTECFPNLVRNSLEGGDVEGIKFERNPGLIQKDKLLAKLNEENSHVEKEFETNEGSTTKYVENKNSVLVLFDSSRFLEWETVVKIPSKEEFYHLGLNWMHEKFTNSTTNGKAMCRRGDYPKWLLKLAVLIFGNLKSRKKYSNIAPRNLRNFQGIHFFSRTLP